MKKKIILQISYKKPNTSIKMGKRPGQIFHKRRNVNSRLNRRKHCYFISNQKNVNEIKETLFS